VCFLFLPGILCGGDIRGNPLKGRMYFVLTRLDEIQKYSITGKPKRGGRGLIILGPGGKWRDQIHFSPEKTHLLYSMEEENHPEGFFNRHFYPFHKNLSNPCCPADPNGRNNLKRGAGANRFSKGK